MGTKKQTTVSDSKRIFYQKDTQLEEHINELWDALSELKNKTTKSVTESELKHGRNQKNKVGSMLGEKGDFRLKETSNGNAVEICGDKSWQTLSSKLPDLTAHKVAASGSDAENIADLRTKLDGLITALSKLDMQKAMCMH